MSHEAEKAIERGDVMSHEAEKAKEAVKGLTPGGLLSERQASKFFFEVLKIIIEAEHKMNEFVGPLRRTGPLCNECANPIDVVNPFNSSQFTRVVYGHRNGEAFCSRTCLHKHVLREERDQLYLREQPKLRWNEEPRSFTANDINRTLWEAVFEPLFVLIDPKKTVKFENDFFVLRRYTYECDCEYEIEHGHYSDCPVELPNFHYKPSGLELHWYKYPFRGVRANKKVESFEALDLMVAHCVRSIFESRGGGLEVLGVPHTHDSYYRQRANQPLCKAEVEEEGHLTVYPTVWGENE